jgi:propanediol dehydratase small subunit
MGSPIPAICIVVAAVIVGVAFELRRRKHLQKYWDRICTGVQWRQQFPNASKTEIRNFLNLFVDAFGFSKKKRLCFSPSDKVMDVYRTLYPDRLMADGMELESLTRDLERRYRINASNFWRDDITLGELFSKAMSRSA